MAFQLLNFYNKQLLILQADLIEFKHVEFKIEKIQLMKAIIERKLYNLQYFLDNRVLKHG